MPPNIVSVCDCVAQQKQSTWILFYLFLFFRCIFSELLEPAETYTSWYQKAVHLPQCTLLFLSHPVPGFLTESTMCSLFIFSLTFFYLTICAWCSFERRRSHMSSYFPWFGDKMIIRCYVWQCLSRILQLTSAIFPQNSNFLLYFIPYYVKFCSSTYFHWSKLPELAVETACAPMNTHDTEFWNNSTVSFWYSLPPWSASPSAIHPFFPYLVSVLKRLLVLSYFWILISSIK